MELFYIRKKFIYITRKFNIMKKLMFLFAVINLQLASAQLPNPTVTPGDFYVKDFVEYNENIFYEMKAQGIIIDSLAAYKNY